MIRHEPRAISPLSGEFRQSSYRWMLGSIYVVAVASTLAMYARISSCFSSPHSDPSMKWISKETNKNHDDNGLPSKKIFQFDDVFEPRSNNDTKVTWNEPPPEELWLTQNNDENVNSFRGKIPKLINKLYFQIDGQFPLTEYIALMGNLTKAHKSWQDMNPGYTVRYFNLVSSRNYLRDYFHPVFLRTFDCIEAFAGKSNFFRMALLYREGGWHSDWKQVCLKPNLLDIIAGKTDVFIAMDVALPSTRRHNCVQNAFLGSVPKHPIISNHLRIVMQHVHDSYYQGFDLFTTGTCVLGMAVKEEAMQYNDSAARLKQTTSMGKFDCNEKRTVCHFYLGNEQIVLHKCAGCGHDQNWALGNNYQQLYRSHNYYCEDSASIFNP